MNTNYKSVVLLISTFFALSVSISAAPDDLDLSFGSGGIVINSYPFNLDIISDIAIQPDGKIVGVGTGTDPETNNVDFAVVRYNPDGSLDTSFGGTGIVVTPVGFFTDWANAVAIQADGKIVAVGTAYNFDNDFAVVRLDPNGALDTTFGGIGTVLTPVAGDDQALAAAIQPDGKIVAAGWTNTGMSPDPLASALVRYQGGASANTRTRFDFDGDGRADLATYLAADGMWSILNSTNYQTIWRNFGLSEDKTIAADYDGDLRTDTAVFRPSDGTWYLLRSRDGFGAVQWGAAGDKPATGDFDGDRKADFAVWRPSTGVWWILNSSNGAATVVRFGLTDDIPLSHADFDGDRKADIGVWRPSNGVFYWLASGSNNIFNAVRFGQNGDIPAVADYNGDGKTDLVVFRPADRNWYQYLTTPTGEYGFSATTFGLSGDEPVAADYDGDGKTDIAVRRGSEWHILNSALGYSAQIFGDGNARAVAASAVQ